MYRILFSKKMMHLVTLVLKENNQIKTLHLSYNDLSDERTVTKLIKIIEHNVIQDLRLCSTNIDTACVVKLFKSLENNTSIHTLDISENKRLGPEAFIAYNLMRDKNSTLQKLVI